MCLPAPTAGRCEERSKVKGEGRSGRTRSKSRRLLTPGREGSGPARGALMCKILLDEQATNP